MRPSRFLWHCGWCRPLTRWQHALYPLGIRWSTGICASCLEHERQRRRAKRQAVMMAPTERVGP